VWIDPNGWGNGSRGERGRAIGSPISHEVGRPDVDRLFFAKYG